MRQFGDDVFDNDDRRVDEHANRDSKTAKAHQVCRHTHQAHQYKCRERGKR